ncbi:MAG TPA: phosphoribosylaminoimidazolesuccinocarboxamide synthase [Bacteroidales bacterium]|nr:phosphoribosylaminoimidazolesuccinocarboxamide synthase [Bacteroidales bacterium]
MKTNFTKPFKFKNQTSFYRGKVRDVYSIDNTYLVMVVSDRISAFDVVMPEPIPYKGQVLNQIAAEFLDATADIVPNWKISTPHPMVTIGYQCKPYPVEMIIRGYLTGSAWRTYKSGKREICGVPIPDGMREHQKFDKPIITPTTKAEQGSHDEDISREEIIAKGLVKEEEYETLEKYTLQLFERGSEIARKHGLILVDTKYEFGVKDNKIVLIDEIHTPDSSRYFYADTYAENFERGLPQKQLSKEFLREWLMEQGFQGRKEDKLPEFTPEIINTVSKRYLELYEQVTAKKLKKVDYTNIEEDIFQAIETFLQKL